MRTAATAEGIDHDRRRLLTTAAMGIAVAGAASFLPARPGVAAAAGDAIRPFRVDVPEEALADLRRRIAATRWPERETVADHSQGVQLATIQDLARYWATDYDWRKCEARLNALPQFVTEIDGLDIHFIHVRSKHAERAAGHHHARLAGLDHRAAEDHRSAHRPDGPRRERRGRLRRRDPVDAGLRVLGQADGDRLGSRSASRAPGPC